MYKRQFRRRPPQSNSPPGIVHCPVHGHMLEIQYCKGGIPTLTPRQLASPFLSLPPILYMQYRIPVPSWSKAPWGLSVLARVTSIFTGTSISPDALSRQCSNQDVYKRQGCGISKTTRMLAQKQPYMQRVRNSSLVERSCAENVRG